jgi:RimJ/RimL family protein N-acetyltransferase
LKGLGELGVREVFAVTMKANLASQRVMQKAGLVFSREFYSPDFPNTGELDVEYAVRNENWQRPQ